MDYIREELQRQRLLLSALLTGRTPPEKLQTAAQMFLTGNEDLPAWEFRGSAGAQTAALLRRREAELQAVAFLGAPGEELSPGETAALEAFAAGKGKALWMEDLLRSGRRPAVIPGDDLPAARRGRPAENPGAVILSEREENGDAVPRHRMRNFAGGGPFSAGRGADVSGAAPASAGLPTTTETGGAVRLVAELYQTERDGPSDPAELSRAFQRDARRYDGGFRLY